MKLRQSTKATEPSNPSATTAIDLHAAATFLALLDPNAKKFTFQTIPETGAARGKPQILHGSIAELGSQLAKLNRQGHGIFVTTQRMDGNGRSIANFSKLRSCFIDIDARSGGKLPARWRDEPGDRKGKRQASAGLRPQIIVESSPGSFHCWWLLSDAEDLKAANSLEQWRGVQRQLVQRFNSDPIGCIDVTKVLRVPGFLHQKGKPHLVRAVRSVSLRWSLGELAKVYTPIQPRPYANRHPMQQQPVNPAVLKSALDHLAKVPHRGERHSTTYSDNYEAWMLFGLAIFRSGVADAFDLWHSWSKASRVYPGAEKCREKWAQFERASDRSDRVTVGSIFYIAKRHGWSHGTATANAQLWAALSRFRPQSSSSTSNSII